MRIDLCRKCGNGQTKFEYAKRCNICGKEFTQFTCKICDVVTEPQYHIHEDVQMPLLSARIL